MRTRSLHWAAVKGAAFSCWTRWICRRKWRGGGRVLCQGPVGLGCDPSRWWCQPPSFQERRKGDSLSLSLSRWVVLSVVTSHTDSEVRTATVPRHWTTSWADGKIPILRNQYCNCINVRVDTWSNNALAFYSTVMTLKCPTMMSDMNPRKRRIFHSAERCTYVSDIYSIYWINWTYHFIVLRRDNRKNTTLSGSQRIKKKKRSKKSKRPKSSTGTKLPPK